MTTIAIILAGGEGSRLRPLTTSTQKALVPFCNTCALIDFALSNVINSQIRRCYIVVQDAQHEAMARHIVRFIRALAAPAPVFECVSPGVLGLGTPFQGTADALWRAFGHACTSDPRPIESVYVCGADHLYLFDIREALSYGRPRGAAGVVVGGYVPLADASRYGIVTVNDSRRVFRLDEKPRRPTADPASPNHALVSMGDYVFDAALLSQWHPEPGASDIATHVVPTLLGKGNALVFYNFEKLNRLHGRSALGYWRDIGTVASYWQSSVDALDGVPSLLDRTGLDWPLYTGLPLGVLGNRSEWPGSAISIACRVDGCPRLTRCVALPGSVIEHANTEDGAVVAPGATLSQASAYTTIQVPGTARTIAVYG